MNAGTLPVRPAARVLLFDENNHLLLFRYRDDAFANSDRPQLFTYWLSPGGGQEAGESLEQTALRELSEECGFADIALSHCVALRRIALIVYGRQVLCEEHFFVGRVPGVKPAIDISGQFQNELDVLEDIRWWRAEDLAHAPEPVVPTGLPGFVPRLIAGDLPATPVFLEG